MTSLGSAGGAALAQMALSVAYLYLITLGLKTLPLLLWACLPRRGRRLLAALLSLALLTIVLLLYFLDKLTQQSLVIAVATLLYYLLASLLIFRLGAFVRSGSLKHDALFVAIALLTVFVPALPLRQAGATAMLVFGWNLTLSGYSYCVESRRLSEPRLSDFLFFLWIDPTLSYPDRSRPAPIAARVALRRLASGTGTMLVGQQLVKHWGALTQLAIQASPSSVRALSTLLMTAAIFFPVYWLRSGSADVRIGLMQSAGYAPPECFKQPLLAVSPADFWRRWNCWVGDWLKRYLFAPLSLWLMRKNRRLAPTRGTALARSTALFASFLAMGGLHDWLTWAAEGQLHFVYLRVFTFAALGLLAWEASTSIRRADGAAPQRSSALQSTISLACQATYVGVIVLLSTSALG